MTNLDDFDRKLLAAMQTDMRQTHQQLGDAINLSASQISRRMQRLIDSGLIPAVHGVVRWRSVDLCQWTFEEFRVVVSRQTLSRELRAMALVRNLRSGQGGGRPGGFRRAFERRACRERSCG